jgi:hypothetical protein
MWLGINATTIAAFAEIENGSDRTIAVVSGAIVDSAVTDILRRDLKRDDSTYSIRSSKTGCFRRTDH